MQIIPVIDIRGGIVVHARGGNREAYPPLTSSLSDSSKLQQVIADLLCWYPFRSLYIADLDAIETGRHDVARYRELGAKFPQLEIWLDAGIRHQADYQLYQGLEKLVLVLGSESLQQPELLKDEEVKARTILSLDRRLGQFLGDQALLDQPENWPRRLIAMNLDTVGADAGPGYEWLAALKQQNEKVELYAAGGVRGEQDLLQLQKIGVAGVLVASALHSGRLSREVVRWTIEQEHRSR